MDGGVFSVVGIVLIGSLVYRIFKAWTDHMERRIELMGPSAVRNDNLFQQVFQTRAQPQNINGVTDELRAEIRRVSDVATQYDMSIQHSLEQIQRRLDFIELQLPATRSQTSQTIAQEPEKPVTVGSTTFQQ